MTPGQARAVRQLEDVAAIPGDVSKLLAVTHVGDGPQRWLRAEIEVPCGHYPRAQDGIAFNARERLLIYVPPGFPFDKPYVVAPHERWAGYPHVMRDQTLCLYQAPASEWDPSDGMFGFLDRLDQWLAAAALGQLDPMDAPLHPPLAYMIAGTTAPSVIVRADAPTVGDAPWLGFAVIEPRGDRRLELTGWIALPPDDPVPANAALAILLTEPLPPLFPRGVRDLFAGFEARGVPRQRLLLLLKLAALFNDEGAPLYFVVGAPMRGVRGAPSLRQHVEIWRIPAVVAEALRVTLLAAGGTTEIQQLGDELEQLILEWADQVDVDWCNVVEARPEIVVSRDAHRPTAWFAGRAVGVWGCGALGGPVAEALVRAGVKAVVLRDKAVVGPGLLVRQRFDDADIGRGKAEALADRLRRIRPDAEVVSHSGDLLSVLDQQTWADGVDVIIDTTGSEAVLAKLELTRQRCAKRPAIATMVIGHEARNGFVAIAASRHTGGPADVCRHAKIVACRRSDLQAFRDEFWPSARRLPFQPEPGCSEPTFVGGAADVDALAGTLLNATAETLAANVDSAMAHFVSLPSTVEPALSASATLRFEPDLVILDPHAGYEIRMAREAYAELQAWLRRSARLFGGHVETGGYLFGDRDDATNVLWVTEVSGPPPDSTASPDAFICGIEGTDTLTAEKRRRTRDAVRFVGLWHAHPDATPVPSGTDVQGMAHVISDSGAPSARALLMIVGNTIAGPPMIGAYDFSREDVAHIAGAGLRREIQMQVLPAIAPSQRRVGLALSGGGSRAIAFHLGCFRALHDRGILDQLQVVSSVSGGSVIAAMYAYSDGPFEHFDQAVVNLLRRGLLRGVVQGAMQPGWLLRTLATMVTAGATAKAVDTARIVLGTVARCTGAGRLSLSSRLRRLQPPLSRWSSRTDLLEATLRDEVFGRRPITSPRRGQIDTVLNACELRTGSAFRFGSRESGCWRYGRVADNATVQIAHAVAASAAYPALLPALDRTIPFVNRRGEQTMHRVLLTDGGIFDNLGTSCFAPGRDEAYSTNVFKPSYVIACDAGPGIFGDHVVPYWWPTRMTRAFESVFRKAGNAGYQQLHQLRAGGMLRGFVLAYLGQQDDTLPYKPTNLVERQDVIEYPTDFAPMSDDDIRRLSDRGEQLTRLLIDYYCPEL